MSYSTKYLFRFESYHGVEYNIYLQQDGYNGSVIQRRLGRAPVIKKKKNGPICCTSLELYAECQIDGEFAGLYTSNPKEFLVEVYRGGTSSTGTLVFLGYVSPELYSEPNIAPPYDVQIVATDGLGELKLYNYEEIDADGVGEIYLYNLLLLLLGLAGYTTNFYFATNLFEYGGSKSHLPKWFTDMDHMIGKSCYEILKLVLDSLHASIVQYRGRWLIARETDIETLLNNNGTLAVITCSTNGAISTTNIGNVKASIGQMGVADMWPVGNLSTVIEPAKKSVTTKMEWHPKNILQNPDMGTDTVWTKYQAEFDQTKGGFHVGHSGILSPVLGSIGQDISIKQAYPDIHVSVKAYCSLESYTIWQGAPPRIACYLMLEVSGGLTYYYLKRGWTNDAPTSEDDFEFITPEYNGIANNASVDRASEYSWDFPSIGDYPLPATLSVFICGDWIHVFSAELTENPHNKGYKDTIKINNGARGEAEEVELMGGRLPVDRTMTNEDFYGLWGYNDALLTKYTDSHNTNKDFLSLMSLDYAISVALERKRMEGVLDVPASLTYLPLMVTDGNLKLWIETYEWDLLNDELAIKALSLPAASLTVESETVTEMTGGSSGGSSSGGGGGGGTAGVTLVDMTVPTGFKVSGVPIMSSGTIAMEFDTGYSLPTTTKQSEWDSAYSAKHSHSNKSALDDITATKITNWDSAASHEHTHSNKSVLDGITSQKVSNWDAAYTDKHTHSNKSVLDGITANDVNHWDGAAQNEHSHSNKSVLDGITSTKVSHWDTAYGWGDHAQAGYITQVTASMVTSALGYIPADVEDLIKGAGLQAPTLRIFRGYDNASGQYEFAPYIEVKHPLLSISGLNAQCVLMVWSKRRGRKGATSTKRYPTYTSGWGEVRGRLATTAAFILNGGAATLDSIRQFILNKCLCGSDFTQAQMEVMTLATFRSYTNLVRKFGFKGKHAQQINDFVAKGSRLFGIAIRYENPAWAAHVSGTVAETTREVDDGTTHGKVQRYFYTDVAAFRVHCNAGQGGYWDIGFQLQPINGPKK